MIKLNDLLGYNKKIYQDDNNFKFTIDSVLLAEFIKIKKTTKRILEIGSGTGAISLILSTKTNANIDAVEIQEKLALLFNKSIKYNNLEKQIKIYNEDIKNSTVLKNNYYDIIVCNPPYFKETTQNKNINKNIARHDINLSLTDIAIISKKNLKNNGSLNIIYDTKRLMETLEIMIKNNLIPKRLKFIYRTNKKESDVFLLECTKNGNIGLKVESPLVLYGEKGKVTNEYAQLINGKEV